MWKCDEPKTIAVFYSKEGWADRHQLCQLWHCRVTIPITLLLLASSWSHMCVVLECLSSLSPSLSLLSLLSFSSSFSLSCSISLSYSISLSSLPLPFSPSPFSLFSSFNTIFCLAFSNSDLFSYLSQRSPIPNVGILNCTSREDWSRISGSQEHLQLCLYHKKTFRLELM